MSAIGPMLALTFTMWSRIKRLFTIKTRFEAFMIIYALGVGAVDRGIQYVEQYPGMSGWLLFAVCPITVFMAGGCILDSLELALD